MVGKGLYVGRMKDLMGQVTDWKVGRRMVNEYLKVEWMMKEYLKVGRMMNDELLVERMMKDWKVGLVLGRI